MSKKSMMICNYITQHDQSKAIQLLHGMNDTEMLELSNYRDYRGWPLLHVALFEQQVDVIKELVIIFPQLLLQAYPEHLEPLEFCAKYNCLDSAKILLDVYKIKNIDMQKQLDMALLITADLGFNSFLTYLLHNGALPTAVNSSNEMAIHCAIRKANISVVNELTSWFGQDIVNQRAVNGDTPLILCCKHLTKNYDHIYSIILKLLKEKADLSLTNNQGITPLHIVVYNQSEEVIGMFLEFGANREQPSLEGKSSFLLAIEGDNPDILSLFITDYPNPNPQHLSVCYAQALQNNASSSKIILLMLKMFMQDHNITMLEPGPNGTHRQNRLTL